MKRANGLAACIFLVLACDHAENELAVILHDLDVSDCPPGSNVIVGTAGPDVLIGTNGADCILGLGGDDDIQGLQGDDFLVGGDGSDRVDGGNGSDQIYGDDGDDSLVGGTGPDTIDGGEGNDIISGDNGPDTVAGGGGNDVILDSRGPSTVDPGDGTDSCSAPGCELGPATRCATTADCALGMECIGGACLFCLADAGCNDGEVCDGTESCVPVLGCQEGTDLPAGYDLGLDCRAGVGACARFGGLVCDGFGEQLCTAVPGDPTPDTDCDGVDDDCNGSPDDGGFVPSATTCGVGACAATGVSACPAPGMLVDSCTPGAPSPEVCDGLDNDCNGLVDDGGLLDSDGDTLCDDPRVGSEPATGTDPCPYHPDPTVTAPPSAAIVTGHIDVTLTNQETSVNSTARLGSFRIRTAFGSTVTDCNGNFYHVFTDGRALIPGPQEIHFSYETDVPGPGGISTRVEIVDDTYTPWGTGFGHDGFWGATTSTLGTDALGRATLTFVPLNISTSEADLFYFGVKVAEDFHRVTGMPVPNGELSYMRQESIRGDAIGPYTNFDTVIFPAEPRDLDVFDTPADRAAVMFHESGHLIRHLLDGGRLEFDTDSAQFTYATAHSGYGVYSEGYSFNEGWATFWERARYHYGSPNGAELPFEWTNGQPTPPASVPIPPAVRATPCDDTMTGRDFSARDGYVVIDAANVFVPRNTTTDPWCAPQSVTDYEPGAVGGRGVLLTAAHLDWVEHMVADRLFTLENTGCTGATTTDAADAVMVSVLANRTDAIHSIWEFEQALCSDVPACCPFIRTTRNEVCPPNWTTLAASCIGPDEQFITRGGR